MWKDFSLKMFVGFWNFLKFPSWHSCHRFETGRLRYTSSCDSRLRYLWGGSVYVCMYMYTYVPVCICVCTHTRVYILAPFLQAFVFNGSLQCAWSFFISAELLLGKGFAQTLLQSGAVVVVSRFLRWTELWQIWMSRCFFTRLYPWVGFSLTCL